MDQLRDQLTAARTRTETPDTLRRPVRGRAAYAFPARVALLAIVALVTGAAVAGRDGAVAAIAPDARGAPVKRVTGGASSMDELMERFLSALQRGDRDTLEALRLTKDEYVHLVMPGHVPPGQPPQALSPAAADYFYSVMDLKSRYFRDALVARFAGRKLELREVTFDKGIGEYAGHRSYKRAVLRLLDEDGGPIELRIGSVVQRDGRLKFASYIRD